MDFGNHRVDINIHMPRTGRVNLHTGEKRSAASVTEVVFTL